MLSSLLHQFCAKVASVPFCLQLTPQYFGCDIMKKKIMELESFVTITTEGLYGVLTRFVL